MTMSKTDPLSGLRYGYKVFLTALTGIFFAAAVTLVLFLPPRPTVGAWVAEFTFWGVVLAAFLVLSARDSSLPWFVALRWAAWIGITLSMLVGFRISHAFSWELTIVWVVAIALFELSLGGGKSTGRKK